MILFKLKINDFGFTLLEAMITVAIIAIMSSVYLVSYRSTNQKIILDQAVSMIISDLRLAQNMAMNVKQFNGNVPIGGYGIHISNTGATNYIFFADCNSDSHSFDGADTNCLDGAGNPITEKVNNRDFSANVKISAVVAGYNIVFEPPYPVVWIDGKKYGDVGAQDALITLQYGSNPDTKTIKVDRFTGRISSE